MTHIRLSERYDAREEKQVWDDLRSAKADIWHFYEDAYEVAQATMQRVAYNIQLIRQNLINAGYEFLAKNEDIYRRPDDRTDEKIAYVEEKIGPLPLVLKVFYEVVGSVDFRQSQTQLIKWMNEKRPKATELQLLGEQDPLVVFPIDTLIAKIDATPTLAPKRAYFCFAPDEFHKANYSGGENYHLWLPDLNADCPIYGIYDWGQEYFLEHLRICCLHGGFRGAIIHTGDQSSKPPPSFAICKTLAKGVIQF